MDVIKTNPAALKERTINDDDLLHRALRCTTSICK